MRRTDNETSSSEADVDDDDGESCSEMTGTRDFRPLTAQRSSSRTAGPTTTTPAAPSAASSATGSKSLSSRVVAQLSSSLTQIAETQTQQQEAIQMLGQRVEAEVAARSADISLLTNEFKNMRLAAAEERAEILEVLRKGRSSKPTSPWIVSRAAAEYAAARAAAAAPTTAPALAPRRCAAFDAS